MGKQGLGQVFTKKAVAEYMVRLFDPPKDAFFLDPCFGKGVFIDCLQKAGYTQIMGMELDAELYETFADDQRKKEFPAELINSDFLAWETEKRFDGIIMNPPYIRHEKIDDLKNYGISKSMLSNQDLYNGLPKTANLYMYFVLKAISLLKSEGKAIVIFPETWLYAKSGVQFQRQILKECKIAEVTHVHGRAFETEALVDVIILKLVKTQRELVQRETSFYVEEQKSVSGRKAVSFTSHVAQEKLLHYAHVRRGLTTGCNRLFVNVDLKDNTYKRPIISSPKMIDGYEVRVEREQLDSLLVVEDYNKAGREVKKYLNHWKKQIKQAETPRTLYEKILRGVKWYQLSLFDCKGILFGYIVRNQMKFIHNQTDYIVRDNFYIITPLIDEYLLFALLNNYYIYIQLEAKGKRYGSGLLKLQKYDMEDLLICKPDALKEWERQRLCEYGKELAETGDEQFIALITEILANYEAESAASAQAQYLQMKINRLQGE